MADSTFFTTIRPWTDGKSPREVAGQLRTMGIELTDRAVGHWLAEKGVPGRLVVTPFLQAIGVPEDVQATALRAYCPPPIGEAA